MDLNQALNFIRFHEGRRESAVAQRRAEETALLSREKFTLQRGRFAFDVGKEVQRLREKEIDNEKWVISSYTDSYHKAKTMGEKRVIRETMKNYYSSLSGSHRRALEPVIRHSPLSPMEEKRAEFWRVHGDSFPREPSVEDYKDKNYGAIAKYKFDLLDFEKRQSLFLTGQAKSVPKFVGLDGDIMAMKTESGLIHILNKEETGFHQAADEAGVEVSELYANGGVLQSKTPMGIVTENGKHWEVYLDRNVFDGKYSKRRKLVGDATTSIDVLPQATRTLLEDVAFGNPDNVVAVAMREAIEAGDKERTAVAQFLTMTNRKFRFSFGKTTPAKMRWYDYATFALPGAFLTLEWAKLKEKIEQRRRVNLFITQGEARMVEVPDYGRHEVFVTPDGTVRDLSGQIIGRSGEEAIGRLAEEFKRIEGE